MIGSPGVLDVVIDGLDLSVILGENLESELVLFFSSVRMAILRDMTHET